MELTFKRLNAGLCDDYLSYFDNVAFTDHEEWSACYCLESHLSKEENDALKEKALRREKAAELVRNGTMQGYLLYDGESVVGWCNVGDKADYRNVLTDESHKTVELSRGVVKAIYCIDIAPEYRGKGLAHLIVEKVCGDAAAEGYQYVEGYPFVDKMFPYQYHGPVRLFEKHGFICCGQRDWFFIMQKSLRR